MDFEWDEAKAVANQSKHCVSFIEATQVFSDEYSSCVDDPDHSVAEARYLLFGLSTNGKFLVVSFTERSERIRIISARLMTKQERNAYEH